MEPLSPNPPPLKPQPLSESQSQSQSQPAIAMDFGFPPIDDPDSTALFDWGDLLDFGVLDDPFSLPPPSPIRLDQFSLQISDNSNSNDFEPSAERLRKRDPKLTCENFLAGRVPCACPEMDALLAEEEELRGAAGKKRARTVRGKAVNEVVLSCQVVGCEADISELKGYHKRHRVCLNCANASSVMRDGESKRYCQQCGKFHVLSDFDEGKRSCRRKLERHNNRRRRKHTNMKGSTKEESQLDPLAEEADNDIEAGKASVSLKTKISPNENLVRSEDLCEANVCSTLGSQDTRTDSPASDETNLDGTSDKYDSSKCCPSLSNGDKKSPFSSVCPTGRISFKLYDWNPAEFPRRLRHQIFQWLACMPVELEGYIRPGCTILTVFLSMPTFMWVELFRDPASQLQDFISAPGRLLSGKGSMHIHLDNIKIFIARDGNFVKKVLTDVQAPKLHYVHPTFFEAGKQMEFVVCGSNLLQKKFRLLVSFQEKYVVNECYMSFSPGHSEMTSISSFNHQKYKIYAPLTDTDVFGPAFIEVENQFGLSNYIPILIGDKAVCYEMESIQQKCVQSFCLKSVCEADNCEVYAARHATFSEFLLDIAWLLKKPASESLQDSLTSSQIKRYDTVLNYLIQNDSTTILDRVLKSLNIRITNAEKNNPAYATCEDGIRFLQKRINQASNILRLKRSGSLMLNDVSENSIQQERTSSIPIDEEDASTREVYKSVSSIDSAPSLGCETVPLLLTDDSINIKHLHKLPRQSCSALISRTRRVPHTRTTLSLAAVAIVCFGVCAVILHPHKVGQFAVTVRRCLFDRT